MVDGPSGNNIVNMAILSLKVEKKKKFRIKNSSSFKKLNLLHLMWLEETLL